MLDVYLEVILQILSDAGQVVHRVDSCTGQNFAAPDSGELKQLGRVDRAATDDDLSAERPPGGPASPIFDGYRAPRFKQNSCRLCPAQDRQI